MHDLDFFFTKRTLHYAAEISQQEIPRPIKFKKVNWSVVCTSHDICKVRGIRGHNIRQNIRRSLWGKIQHYNPSMKKTILEKIFGVWVVYKFKKLFQMPTS